MGGKDVWRQRDGVLSPSGDQAQTFRKREEKNHRLHYGGGEQGPEANRGEGLTYLPGEAAADIRRLRPSWLFCTNPPLVC